MLASGYKGTGFNPCYTNIFFLFSPIIILCYIFRLGWGGGIWNLSKAGGRGGFGFYCRRDVGGGGEVMESE